MQSRNGGWGAFDKDNDAYWLYEIPFFDFGAIIDPPSVDVSGHAVELLAKEPGYEEVGAPRRRLPAREQEENGSWFGRWGVNYVYGTGAALPALEAAGITPDHPAMRRAVAWLESVQQEGWRLRGGLSLLRRGRRRRGLARPRRADRLADRLGAPRADRRRRGANRARPPRAAAWLGGDTSARTGIGTSRTSRAPASRAHFLINYHLYRTYWPVMALGRLKAARA